jgi:hypothetical protein
MATEPASPRKKQTKPRERHFDIEDTLLLQRSRTIRQHYIDNLAGFTAFDADLDMSVAGNWQTSIDESEAHPTDETMGDDLQNYTAEMDAARNACFSKANELEFFVEKAFPGKKAVLKEFGFTERKKARARVADTLLWMRLMRKVAVEVYPAELAAVNMPAALITDLETVQINLSDKELAQEFFKRLMLRETRLRIEKFNRLHSFIVTVHRAAQSVFLNDKERRQLFNLN